MTIETLKKLISIYLEGKEVQERVLELIDLYANELAASAPAFDNFKDSRVPYYTICSCNPANGGSGICGCTMANRLVNPVSDRGWVSTTTYVISSTESHEDN